MAFIDLSKAFDSVNRKALWWILAKYSCPEKFITIVKLLHGGMVARVLDSCSSSEPFEVPTSIEQGCVIAPSLYQQSFS